MTHARQRAGRRFSGITSGSNNPGDCDGNPGPGSNPADPACGDAAWLDGWWAQHSGAGNSPLLQNGRLQTAYARHNNRINVAYVDGHCVMTLPSRLTWGEFWGIYGPSPALPWGQNWNGFISTPAYDSQVWSAAAE